MKKIIIVIFISIAGLYLAFRKVELSLLTEILSNAKWIWVLVGIGLIVFSIWLRAVRWRILLEPIKSFRMLPLFSSTMIGYFGNGVLPLRLGELLRAYSIHKEEDSISIAAAFGSIMVERYLDLAGLLLLTIFLFILYDVPSWLMNAGIVLGLLVLGISILLWWISTAHMEWITRLENISFLQKGMGVKIRVILLSFIEGLITVRKTGHIGSLIFTTLSLWMIYLGVTKTSVLALNISLSWIEIGIILVGTAMVISIPSAPGYIGTYHAATVIIMVEIFNKSEIPSQAFAIINHAVGFLPLVIIGFFFLLRSSVKLRELKGLKLKMEQGINR